MVPELVEGTTRRFDKLSDQLSSKFNSLSSKLTNLLFIFIFL